MSPKAVVYIGDTSTYVATMLKAEVAKESRMCAPAPSWSFLS